MEKSHLEAFADGECAIAATLPVVRVSVDAKEGALGGALIHAWPQYAACVLSFLAIGIWLVNHHMYMSVIDRVDRPFLFANIALLVCVAFIPFPTRLITEHFRDADLRAAMITYGAALTGAGGWLFGGHCLIVHDSWSGRVAQRHCDGARQPCARAGECTRWDTSGCRQTRSASPLQGEGSDLGFPPNL